MRFFIFFYSESSTGKLLNDIGILEQSQRAWQKTLSTSARGYLWVETNAPIYYSQALEACKPYSQLSKDALIVAKKQICSWYTNLNSFFKEKRPVILATIEQYAPGLIDKINDFTMSCYETVVKYSSEYYRNALDYLGTNVFM